MSKKVVVTYSKSRQSVTRALHQYDYGQILVFDGDQFPEIHEVHFSNEGDKNTTIVFGTNNKVQIPDKYLKTGEDIYAWVYSHVRACDGESVYKVLIPVIKRGSVENQPPDMPMEYIFDGRDASYDDITPCVASEQIINDVPESGT